MIIPWKVDVPQERLPIMNWLLIASIVAAFFLQSYQIKNHITVRVGHKDSSSSAVNSNNTSAAEQKSQSIEDIKKQILQKMKDRDWVYPFEKYILNGWHLNGMIGHIWLHAGLIHLIGNMLFLWIFGNAICAKLGNIAYLPVFIVLGVFAAMGHLMFHGGSAVGASGAINGIVGMFLALFPLNNISCLWIVYPLYMRFHSFEVSSFWVILFWLAWDIFGAVIGHGNVAYFAHLGGFAAGVAITLILLKMKIIKTTSYEKSLLDLFAERNVIVQPVTPYSHKVLVREYPVVQQDSSVNVSPAETAVENRRPVQPLLSMEDFFKTDSPMNKSQLVQQGAEQKNDGFIRFYCDCGKRCKIPIQFAGQKGKCPKCNKPVKIPHCR